MIIPISIGIKTKVMVRKGLGINDTITLMISMEAKISSLILFKNSPIEPNTFCINSNILSSP